MSEHEPEIEPEDDHVPGRLIGVVIAATIIAIVASGIVAWGLMGYALEGGGRSDIEHLSIEPPADPFAEPTAHELRRGVERHRLDEWTWADPGHTRVRVPIRIAIDRYVRGER
jgi:hypothetical protein